MLGFAPGASDGVGACRTRRLAVQEQVAGGLPGQPQLGLVQGLAQDLAQGMSQGCSLSRRWAATDHRPLITGH